MKKAPDHPVAPACLLLRWFFRHRRDLPWRRRHDLYAIWVSEVMLQQTRIETMVPYFHAFLRRFPSLKKLAAAPLRDVLKAWEGLGYYARARNLWRAAGHVVEHFHGRIPVDYDRFRELPGVGDYIAAAVLSIGRGFAVPVVDGNVLRVACRWQGIKNDIRLPATNRSVRAFLQTVIPADAPGPFNEAMMELGALVCLPVNPRCRLCPLRQDCFAFSRDAVDFLPVRSKKKPVPEHRVALAVILRDGRIFIQQRPERGHLGGLWEFPGGKSRAGEKPEHTVVRECREELGVKVEILAKLGEIRHAYSHFKVVLHVFICQQTGGRIFSRLPHAWVGFTGLQDYPFPAANHKFFPQLKEFIGQARQTAYGRRHRVKKQSDHF